MMKLAYLFLIFVHAFYLGFKLNFFNRLAACSLSFTVLAIVIEVIEIASIIMTFTALRYDFFNLFLVSAFGYSVSGLLAIFTIVYYFLMNPHSQTCNAYYRFDVRMMIMNAVVGLTFIYALLKISYYLFLLKKKTAEAKVAMTDIYERIADPNLNLQEILKKHGLAFISLPFSEKELAILKDSFGFAPTAIHLQGQQDKKECSICLSEFQVGESLIRHPSCAHEFHFACLAEWLKKSGTTSSCPYCKKTTRIVMLKILHQRAKDANRPTLQP